MHARDLGLRHAVTTAGFKGTQHEVAQTISTSRPRLPPAKQKVCTEVLAAAIVKARRKAGCEAAIKNQLAEVDGLEAMSKRSMPPVQDRHRQVKSSAKARKP